MTTYSCNGGVAGTYTVLSGGNIDPRSTLYNRYTLGENPDTAIAPGSYQVSTYSDGGDYDIMGSRGGIEIHGAGITTGCIAVQGGFGQFQQDMADTRNNARKPQIPLSVADDFSR